MRGHVLGISRLERYSCITWLLALAVSVGRDRRTGVWVEDGLSFSTGSARTGGGGVSMRDKALSLVIAPRGVGARKFTGDHELLRVEGTGEVTSPAK